jgi:hypothetical protein
MGIVLVELGIPLLVLSITGPLAVSIFIVLTKTGDRRGLWIFWPTLCLITILLGIGIAYTFGNFFPGWGCFITLLTPVSAIVTIVVARFRSRWLRASMRDQDSRRRWLLIGTLLIPVLQLSAPVIGFGYARTCDALNRQAAKSIVAALETYKAATGSYPVLASPYQSDLSSLVPHYLPFIPQRACAVAFLEGADAGYPMYNDWSLYYCNNSPGAETLLLVPILGSDSRQIFILNTGRWSVGNALDGYCSYLH